MLKDALRQLINETEINGCRIKAIMSSVDTETAEIFKQVLGSDISTISIVKILQGEGFKISRETMRTKRNECFRHETRPAGCCMAETSGDSNETAK
jgi:hypothetical protein